jgi:hypothetical protein
MALWPLNVALSETGDGLCIEINGLSCNGLGLERRRNNVVRPARKPVEQLRIIEQSAYALNQFGGVVRIE